MCATRAGGCRMIRVLLADDHEIVREGLRRVLDAARDIRVVGEVGDGRAALNALASLGDVDVLVLDLSLPRVSGIEVLRRTREISPTTRVLIVSMYPEEQYGRRLAQLGAAGYVPKNRPVPEMLQAIYKVARGETCFASGVAQTGRAKAPHDLLSAREYQVFVLLLQGRTTSEIAAEMNLSGSTVSNHVTAVRTKLGAHTVADVVRYAAREGLIDAPALPPAE